MEEKNNNWIPVTGSAIGALIGGIPGAIVGGLIGALIKELTCPQCGGSMENLERNIWKCKRCGFTMYRE